MSGSTREEYKDDLKKKKNILRRYFNDMQFTYKLLIK